MPKRTKREKILAQKRRHITLAHSVIPQSLESQSPSTTNTFTFQVREPVRTRTSDAGDSSELSVIRKDMGKTIILSLCAIGIEIGIYALLRGK